MRVEYDGLAEAYVRHRKCHPSVLHELVTGGELGKTSRVLEIGTGTGNYIAALQELVGCRCFAVEPSSKMREVAEKNAASVEVRPGKAEELPFEAQSMDFAFCVNVIHHVADRPRLFQEAFRVLGEGKTLCVATESHDMIRKRFVLPSYFPETVDADIARYSSIDELRGMAGNAGFGGWRETRAEAELVVESADIYEAKAFSSLHLISEEAFDAGLRRLKADLERGPLRAVVPVLAMLWITK
jgi:SAM-dependent methyltransferase